MSFSEKSEGSEKSGKVVTPLQRGWSLDTLPRARLRSQLKPIIDNPPPDPPKSRSPVLSKKINAALLTFEELATKIGHEPHSDRLKGLWKRSVHYKEMRTETKGIETTCKQSLATLDEGALTKQIEDLVKAGEAYVNQHKKDTDKVAAGNEVVARARGRLELLKAVTADPAFDKVKNHITIEQALDCKARAIRFEDCDFGALNDNEVEKANDKFGSGNANSVSKLTFKNKDVRVFKAEKLTDDNPLDGVAQLGIDPKSPHNGNRNIATSAVADLLGLKVMPKASFGLHKNPTTGEQEIGLMMGLADGLPPARGVWETWKPPQPGSTLGDMVKNNDLEGLAKKKLRPNPDGPGWQKEVTKLLPPWGDTPPSPKAQAAMIEQLNGLEWCDILTGQTDRHAQNYFVKIDGDNVTVTGIDNDMAFGKLQTKASFTAKEVPARKTPPGLPPLMDKKVYDELMAKNFDRDLLPSLSSLLTEEEVEASRLRFNQAKDHAATLKEAGYVVEDWTSWKSPGEEKLSPRQFLATVQQVSGGKATSERSGGLFGRDFAKMFDEAGL